MNRAVFHFLCSCEECGGRPLVTAIGNKQSRRELGLCHDCPNPRGRGVRCDGCAKNHRKRQQRRHAALGVPEAWI